MGMFKAAAVELGIATCSEDSQLNQGCMIPGFQVALEQQRNVRKQ